MRPEAWLLAGVYWLWLLPRASWPQRVRYAVLAAIGPLVWAATDWAVTGDPLFSLTSTSELAEELGRAKGLEAVPEALYAFLIKLAKFPVVMGAVAGLLLAAALTPRRLAMPAALFGIGVGTFAMVGIAGLSVIERYLLVPSLCVMIFAAAFLAGWTMLREDSRWRRVWAAGAAALVVFGIAFTATRVTLEPSTTSCASAATAMWRWSGSFAPPLSRRRCAVAPSTCPTTSSSPTSAGSSTGAATASWPAPAVAWGPRAAAS